MEGAETLQSQPTREGFTVHRSCRRLDGTSRPRRRAWRAVGHKGCFVHPQGRALPPATDSGRRCNVGVSDCDRRRIQATSSPELISWSRGAPPPASASRGVHQPPAPSVEEKGCCCHWAQFTL